jgi:hypothetical protein
MEDHELERVAGSLGARAARRLDVERVAAGVLARLRAEQEESPLPRRTWWAAPMLLRLAAVLALLVTGGILTRGAWRHAAPPSAVVSVPMLRELTNDELIEVFDSLAVETSVHDGLAVGLENLNEAQLKELLSLMEG